MHIKQKIDTQTVIFITTIPRLTNLTELSVSQGSCSCTISLTGLWYTLARRIKPTTFQESCNTGRQHKRFLILLQITLTNRNKYEMRWNKLIPYKWRQCPPWSATILDLLVYREHLQHMYKVHSHTWLQVLSDCSNRVPSSEMIKWIVISYWIITFGLKFFHLQSHPFIHTL
jgi:hypothetical protein